MVQALELFSQLSFMVPMYVIEAVGSLRYMSVEPENKRISAGLRLLWVIVYSVCTTVVFILMDSSFLFHDIMREALAKNALETQLKDLQREWLDNAVEAASAGTEISLISYTLRDMYFIEIKNSFQGKIKINEITGLPQTAKEDSSLHGIGLENIRSCAERLGGGIDIEIDGENKVFKLVVFMKNNTNNT